MLTGQPPNLPIIGRRVNAERQSLKLRAEIIRSEEHTSELQSLMRNSYAVFCLKKKKTDTPKRINITTDKKKIINITNKHHYNVTISKNNHTTNLSNTSENQIDKA